MRPDAFSTYRAGFEVRTQRLCRRVLMFHRMDEAGAIGDPTGIWCDRRILAMRKTRWRPTW
jgi:hypothetical protein